MRAEETIRREQQLNQEMRQSVGLVLARPSLVCVVTRGPPDYRRLCVCIMCICSTMRGRIKGADSTINAIPRTTVQ